MFAGFTGADLVTILGTVGGAFLAIGKAIQWYVARFDAKTREAMQLEIQHRRSVERAFEERIASLERELNNQRRTIAEMNREKQVYLRRIYQLEGALLAGKLEMPHTEGWPP